MADYQDVKCLVFVWECWLRLKLTQSKKCSILHILNFLHLRPMQKRPVMVIIPVATVDGFVFCSVSFLLSPLFKLIVSLFLSFPLISHQQGLNDDTASVRSVGSYRSNSSSLRDLSSSHRSSRGNSSRRRDVVVRYCVFCKALYFVCILATGFC